MKQKNKLFEFSKICLVIGILLALTVPVFGQEVLNIGLNVSRDLSTNSHNEFSIKNVSISHISVGRLSWTSENRGGHFRAELKSNKETIHTITFNPSFILLSDPPIILNYTYVRLVLPYYENVSRIDVYYKNSSVLSENISSYLCNEDGVCNDYENYLSCPTDCLFYENDSLCLGVEGAYGVSVDFWEDGYCDPDCYNDNDCEGENCNDGIKNQNETFPDEGGECDVIFCGNGNKDLREEGVDCGGPCPLDCDDVICGNGYCQSNETYENCPLDCEQVQKITLADVLNTISLWANNENNVSLQDVLSKISAWINQ